MEVTTAKILTWPACPLHTCRAHRHRLAHVWASRCYCVAIQRPLLSAFPRCRRWRLRPARYMQFARDRCDSSAWPVIMRIKLGINHFTSQNVPLSLISITESRVSLPRAGNAFRPRATPTYYNCPCLKFIIFSHGLVIGIRFDISVFKVVSFFSGSVHICEYIYVDFTLERLILGE